MKRSTILAVVSFFMFGGVQTAVADNHKPNKEEKFSKRIDKMVAAAGMNESQKERFIALRKSNREACKGAENKRSCFKSQKEASKAELESFLSADQIEALKSERKKNRAARKGKRFDRLSKKLGLSDSQKEHLSELRVAAKAKCREAEDRRECRKAQKGEMDAQIKNILNDEQYAQFKELKAQKRARKGKRGN